MQKEVQINRRADRARESLQKRKRKVQSKEESKKKEKKKVKRGKGLVKDIFVEGRQMGMPQLSVIIALVWAFKSTNRT